MTGIDDVEHLAGGVGVSDFRDHAAGRVDAAEVHEGAPVVDGPFLPGARGRNGDLDGAGNAVFDGVLQRHHVEFAPVLGELQGQVDGKGRRLAVARAAAEKDGPVARHADPREDRRLVGREPEILESHPAVEPVAVEGAAVHVIAVEIVGTALAAQSAHRRGQRHGAARADRESLELAPLVGRLRRPVDLAVEEEAHHLPALVGAQRMAEFQLRVVDDRPHAALDAVMGENDIRCPRCGSLGKDGSETALQGTAGGLRCRPPLVRPCGGDILESAGTPR